MADKVDTSDVTALNRKFIDLLSEYGVDRPGIDAAIDIAIEYGESEYNQGFDSGKAQANGGNA